MTIPKTPDPHVRYGERLYRQMILGWGEWRKRTASRAALQEVMRNMGPLRLHELLWLRDRLDEFIEDERKRREIGPAKP